MQHKILVINGHPDPRPERFCAALCGAYRDGATQGGLQVREIAVGAPVPLDLLSDPNGERAILAGHEAVGWADRLVLVFPLWLDQAPQMLRRFFARIAAFREANGPGSKATFSSMPARAVITMEMPAFAQRAALRVGAPAKGLALPGLDIGKPEFIGSVRLLSQECRQRWISELYTRGLRGA